MTPADFIDIASDTKRAEAHMSAKEWRDKYFKWAKVNLSPKQHDFVNSLAKFVYFRSGNQGGKSFALAFFIACTAIGRYPANYKGWKPKLRTDGAYAVVIWVIGPNGQMVRDGLQTHLLGDVGGGNAGTGLIPRDSIVSMQMSRGVGGLCDFAVIKMDDGQLACIRFKSMEQGREAIQAEAVSVIAVDELLNDIAMWNELIARTTSTAGVIRMAATERLQQSPVAKWFREGGSDRITIHMSLDEAVHLTEAQKKMALAQYSSEAERATRYYGLPFQGGGSVFQVEVSEIKERMDPSQFPIYYRYLIPLDFSHFGKSESSSQFAATPMAYDPNTKIIRIFDAWKMRGIPEQHAARILNSGGRGVPIAWPHDGTQGQADGTNIAAQYKKLGLAMLPEHAQFESGGYNFESGIALVDQLLSTGRLKVASHLTEWFDEYQMYERDEAGLVIKRGDDLMSATRVGCMMIRKARVLEEHREGAGEGRRIAKGIDDWDIFTGV